MKSEATSPEAYIAELAPDRAEAIARLRATINASLPAGFEEGMGYGMIGWHVPHSLYPAGYHCTPELPLPFLSIASQKNFVAVYHMGIYTDPQLLAWFQTAYAAVVPTKLDMGKSCMRFKRMDRIPYELIGELVSSMSPQDWIVRYEAAFKS
jgi:uncharacterized protein YdhG (YjbR/CyaY superfamily)